MNILLPKPPFVFNNGAAVVEGNLLYIYRPVDFRELMYALTNAIYDEGRICYYCGAEITEKQRTMDHKYPQDFGGPTITDNLVPTCKKCNTKIWSRIYSNTYRKYIYNAWITKSTISRKY